MRVLLLNHPEADFLEAILYMGLCEEIGPENVIDYPDKPSYHGKTHMYPSAYARDPGTTPWQAYIEGRAGAGPMGTTSPFAWMRAQPGGGVTRDQVIADLKASKFDLMIVASPRAVAIDAYQDLRKTVGWIGLPPVALVDGEDYSDLRWDVIDTLGPRGYFKRELLANSTRLGSTPVTPFPFASVIEPRAPVSKDIDVLFLGGGTWPGREAACNTLRLAFGDRFVGGVGTHLSYTDYLDAVARARVAVSVRGHGYDTLRFWEIPSFDTLLVCDRLPIIKPHPFEDGIHASYFDGMGDLISVVRNALDHEEWRADVARQGNAHLREHHTARARARQLLSQAASWKR